MHERIYLCKFGLSNLCLFGFSITFDSLAHGNEEPRTTAALRLCKCPAVLAFALFPPARNQAVVVVPCR